VIWPDSARKCARARYQPYICVYGRRQNYRVLIRIVTVFTYLTHVHVTLMHRKRV